MSWRVPHATVPLSRSIAATGEPENRRLFERYSTAEPAVRIRPDSRMCLSHRVPRANRKASRGPIAPFSHFLPWQAAHFALTSARFSLLSGLSHDPLQPEDVDRPLGRRNDLHPWPLLGASGQLPAWMARQRISFAHLTCCSRQAPH